MRRKIVPIGDSAWSLLLGKYGGPYRVAEYPLPDDAKVVGVQYDAFAKRTLVLFESAEFEEVPEGALYPELIIQFRMEAEGCPT